MTRIGYDRAGKDEILKFLRSCKPNIVVKTEDIIVIVEI